MYHNSFSSVHQRVFKDPRNPHQEFLKVSRQVDGVEIKIAPSLIFIVNEFRDDLAVICFTDMKNNCSLVIPLQTKFSQLHKLSKGLLSKASFVKYNAGNESGCD